MSSLTTPDRCLCGELQVVGRRAAGATAQHVRADVPGNDGEPGVETALAGETGQRLPCTGERLLRCVLGLVAVVEPAETEAQQPLVVTRVEISECRGVTRLASFDERAITIQIDVVTKACQLFFAERQLIPSLPPFVLPLGAMSHYCRASRVSESPQV